jgi:hypothetical protein
MHWLPGLHAEESHAGLEAPFLDEEHPRRRAMTSATARGMGDDPCFIVAHVEIPA